MTEVELLNQNFRECIEDVMYSTGNLLESYDRVTTMQWIRKLQSMDEKSCVSAKLRNEYANYLRITLSNEVVHLCAPFKNPPPEEELRPLCEVLANYIAQQCPPIPMTGPIEPLMTQSSEDGKTFMTVKQCPNGDLFCYMAVTSAGFEETP